MNASSQNMSVPKPSQTMTKTSKKSIRSGSQSKPVDQQATHRSDVDQELLSKLQMKIVKKNETITQMKEQNIQDHLLWQDEKRSLLHERNDLERNISILKEQINEERAQTLKVKVQMERLTSQLKDTSRIKQHLEVNTSTFDKVQNQMHSDLADASKEISSLKFQLQTKDNKIVSQDEIITHLESKVNKLKQKAELTYKEGLEREMAESSKRKQKHQELTDIIAQLQTRQTDFASEVRALKMQNEELKVSNAQLKDRLSQSEPKSNQQTQHSYQYLNRRQLAMERDELENQLVKLNQIAKNQQYQLEQTHEDLTHLSEQLTRKNQTITHLEMIYQEECESHQKVKQQTDQLFEELKNYKNLVEKMEKQNQMIVDAQTHDFDNIELKVEKISKEISNQKKETDYLKQLNQQLTLECDELTSERKTLISQVKQLKSRNSSLEHQLVQLDDKLREIVKEKTFDVQMLKKSAVTRPSMPGPGIRLKSSENMRRLKKAISDSESDSSLE